jgi:hypothetical protein
MKVAILGCGPAGLFAAQAVRNSGKATELVIFSNRQKSELYGAQYLHAPIPGLPQNSTKILHRISGTPEGYRTKVYGSEATHSVSPMYLDGWREVWDIRSAYSYAWTRFRDQVVDMLVTPAWLVDAGRRDRAFTLNKFDLVINSIPRPSLCLHPQSHRFNKTQVWAVGEAPEIGIRFPLDTNNHLPVVADGNVVCSGLPSQRWCRASRIFGRGTVEWPIDRRPVSLPNLEAVKVNKPIDTNCNCFSVGKVKLHHVGRYGMWKKGILSHHAYGYVKQLLDEM